MRVGRFKSCLICKTFSKQSVRSDGGDRFFQSNVNKYLALINDKAKENQLSLSIEREDENFRLLVGSDTKGVTFDGLLDNAIRVPTIDLFALSWSISSSTISSGALD